MKASKLKELYPEVWRNVESGVWEDLKLLWEDLKLLDEDTAINKTISYLYGKRICYNAAFIACYELHRYLKRRKK